MLPHTHGSPRNSLIPSAPRQRQFRGIAIVTLVSALAFVAGLLIPRARPPLPPALHGPSRAPYDPQATEQTLRFWAARVRQDPQGAIGFSTLASLYLRRCRETGDIAYAVRAEKAARASLAIRRKYNAGAMDELAMSLLTQHRFIAALNIAQRTAAQFPGDLQAAYLCAEIRMESGDYAGSAAILNRLPIDFKSENDLALRGRLAELQGKPYALSYLTRARDVADHNPDMPADSAAWFHMRVGNCLASMGRVDEASKAYHEALAIFPQDYRSLAALAKLEAGQDHWREAIRWGEKAAAIVPGPEMLTVLADAYTGTGDLAAARREFQLMDVIGKLSRASIYDRQTSQFLADHDYQVGRALTLARAEMNVRHDVYAYDTLAWAAYKNGLLVEADAAARKSLAEGTRDAMLYYHAGQIALSRGDRSRARRDLQTALAINPYFHPFAPARIRTILSHLH